MIPRRSLVQWSVLTPSPNTTCFGFEIKPAQYDTILLILFLIADQTADESEPAKKRRKCSQIYPCYIVLTKVDTCTAGSRSVSYRSFKQKFTECSNMCKKMHFRRRLNRGRDVFNVKTPSKQKDYRKYLEDLEKNARKVSKTRTKPGGVPTMEHLLSIHDKIVKKRAKSSHKKTSSRVRRNIIRIPKDFIEITSDSSIEDRVNSTDNGLPSTAGKNGGGSSLQFRRELTSLKRLITIKRESSKKLKQIKKMKSETVDRADGTKSLSGRIRKSNVRYSGDFATNKYELDEMVILETTRSRLNQELRRKKLLEADAKREFLDNGKSKTTKGKDDCATPEPTEKNVATNKKTSNQSSRKSDKGIGSFDIVIENEHSSREFNPERQTTLGEKYHVNDLKRNTMKKGMLENPNVTKTKDRQEIIEETEQMIRRTRKERWEKHFRKSKKSSDGVIIQDMPNDSNVMSKLLQQDPSYGNNSQAKSRSALMTEDIESSPYSHAKALLRESLIEGLANKKSISGHEKLNKTSEKEDQGLSNELSKMHDDSSSSKYTRLRIPEAIQKLSKTDTVSSKTSKNANLGDVREGVKLFPVTAGTSATSSFQTACKLPNGELLCVTQKNTKVAKGISLLQGKTSPQGLTQSANVLTFERRVNSVESPVVSPQPRLQPVPQSLGLCSIPANAAVPNATVTQKIPVPFFLSSQVPLNKPSLPAFTKSMPINLQTTTQSPVKKLIKTKIAVPHSVVHTTFSQGQTTSSTTTQQKSSATTERSKFYLLKIDGKNILIPIENQIGQAPRAIVVNNVSTVCTSSGATVTTSNVGMTSTLDVKAKPTAAVSPSFKIFPSVGTGAANTAMLSGNLPLPASGNMPLPAFIPRVSKTPSLATQPFTPMPEVGGITNQTIKPVLQKETERPKQQELLAVIKQEPIDPEEENAPTFANSAKEQGKMKQMDTVTRDSKTVKDGKMFDNVQTETGLETQRAPEETQIKVPVSSACRKQNVSHSQEKYRESNKSNTDNTEFNSSGGAQEPEEKTTAKAFSEAVTAREERLRRLKQMLKEKQKAVEEIRLQKLA